MRRLLALLVVLLLLCGSAGAQDPCGGGPVASPVKDLEVAVATAPIAQEQWKLPSGTLTAADLEKAFQAIQQQGKGVMGLFGLLSDGTRRVLPGDVVRALFERYGVALEFLPIDALREIVAEGGKVTFRFDFGGEGQREVKLPGGTRKVLDSGHKADPLLVHKKNRVKDEASDGKTLRLKAEVQFTVGPEGLAGLRKGDIQVHHWLAGWVDLDVRSERNPGKVARGEKDRPVLVTDGAGNPLVKDGHYVPQTWDDWVVIEAAGRRIEVGVPPLGGS